jgi:hypothetical protein
MASYEVTLQDKSATNVLQDHAYEYPNHITSSGNAIDMHLFGE